MSGCGCGSYGRSVRQTAGSDMSAFMGLANAHRITRWTHSVTTLESIPYHRPASRSSRPALQYNNNYLTYGQDDDDDDDDSSYSSFASSASSSSGCGGSSTMLSTSSRSPNYTFSNPAASASRFSTSGSSTRLLAVDPCSSYMSNTSRSSRRSNKSRCCSSNC